MSTHFDDPRSPCHRHLKGAGRGVVTMAQAYGVDMVVTEVIRAAAADGVAFDEPSP